MPPGPLTLTESDRRLLVPWAVACARIVLDRFEGVAPEDPRPCLALEGALAFARAELGIGAVRALAAGAHAAARAVGDPSAEAAARACGHAAAVAHMAGHALGAPAYAALAVARADGEAAAADVLDQAVSLASPEVRAVLRTLPPRPAGKRGLARLVGTLQRRLTAACEVPPA